MILFNCDRKNNLTRHRCEHDNEEQSHQCLLDGCNYRCAESSSLARHWLIHNSEKPYQSLFDSCTYRSTAKGEVTQHGNIHSGEKPYTHVHL